MGIFDRINNFVKDNAPDRLVNWLYDTGVKAGLADNLPEQEIEASLTNRLFERVTRPISDIISRFRDDSEMFSYYANLDPDTTPNTNRFKSVDWITANNGYIIEFDVFDTADNFVGSQRSRIDTDDILSQNDLLGLAQDNFISSSGILYRDMDNVRIVGALKKSN